MADPTDPAEPNAQEAVSSGLSPDERELLERFAGFLRSGDLTVPLLRAQRVEIIDAHGRVVVTIGALGPDGADTHGLGIYDRGGSERACLALGVSGPLLSFDHDGNAALMLGVDDPVSHVDRSGTYVELFAPDQTIALGWRVNLDGNVEL